MSALFTGKNLIRLEQVSSTNSVLSEMLSNSKPLADGSVIMADEQLNGKGQQGSFWEASPGKNITLSLLYYPNFLTIDKQFYLSMAISLGVLDFLEELSIADISIKWPNDLYVKKNKIAGILIENSLMGNYLKSSIIGIGLNVNQEKFYSDAPNPISIKQITGLNYDLNQIIPKLFHFIEIHYLQLKAGKFEFLKESYLSSLFRFNTLGSYKSNNVVFQGKIIDIETSGRLVLDVDNHKKSFDTKEIEFLL